MRCPGLILGLLLFHLAAAQAGLAPQVAPGLMCRSAIAAAEKMGAIPPQLMAAIGRVESGRPDASTGAMHPWPWTINAEGQGSYYDSKAEAVAAVRALQARGVRSIDVGCMQVNLLHHPEAFASLDEAFDPMMNANYAARLLNELHAQTNDWSRAAALYHSATPDLAAAYQRKVLGAWFEERRLAGGAPLLTQAWSVTPGGGLRPGALLHAGLPAPMPRGATPVGRSLAAYRAAPILLATWPRPRAGG